MATVGGARAIGVEDRFGTLAADKFADLALFRVEGDQQPESAVIDHAGRATVEAVMSGGRWRVRSGQLISEDAVAAARAADARARSIATLART
jgi:5-methylthioadenosine/S-adenosylhomocysteine deaminase